MATTNLLDLAATEAKNYEATTKHLGFSAELLGDVESVYKAITPLMRSPEGDLDISDELFAFVAILHELRMCGMLLVKSVLAAMRMYRSDSFADLRRAIESCAFAVRMSRHHNLSRIWAGAGLDREGEDKNYRAYRDAFRTKDLYPNDDPILSDLKRKFDLCSKLIHGSVFGMAGHFETIPKEQKAAGSWKVNFFDMPEDSFVSSFFHILGTHCIILRLFGRILEPYAADTDLWKEKYEKEHQYVIEKLQRHMQRWMPDIAAQYAERNNGVQQC